MSQATKLLAAILLSSLAGSALAADGVSSNAFTTTTLAAATAACQRSTPLAEREACLQRLAESRSTQVAVADIKLIGFHGQTIRHAPEQGITLQIGDTLVGAGQRMGAIGGLLLGKEGV